MLVPLLVRQYGKIRQNLGLPLPERLFSEVLWLVVGISRWNLRSLMEHTRGKSFQGRTLSFVGPDSVLVGRYFFLDAD
jgi:hypothetical protein